MFNTFHSVPSPTTTTTLPPPPPLALTLIHPAGVAQQWGYHDSSHSLVNFNASVDPAVDATPIVPNYAMTASTGAEPCDGGPDGDVTDVAVIFDLSVIAANIAQVQSVELVIPPGGVSGNVDGQIGVPTFGNAAKTPWQLEAEAVTPGYVTDQTCSLATFNTLDGTPPVGLRVLLDNASELSWDFTSEVLTNAPTYSRMAIFFSAHYAVSGDSFVSALFQLRVTPNP